MGIEIQEEGFQEVVETMRRRENAVQELETEGRRFTDAYVLQGGRKESRAKRYHPTMRGRRVRRATGNQYARGIEHVAFHRFQDWWGSDW
jgi:hypothetical protein